MKKIISLKLSLESVFIRQNDLIPHLKATNQFYSLRLVETLNRFQYYAKCCKIMRPTSVKHKRTKSLQIQRQADATPDLAECLLTNNGESDLDDSTTKALLTRDRDNSVRNTSLEFDRNATKKPSNMQGDKK